MHIEGSVALVTGANRGLGKAYVDALLAAGAKKIYAGARQPPGAADSRVIPLKLDVTLSADIEAARQRHIPLLIHDPTLYPIFSDTPSALPTRPCDAELTLFA